MCYNYLTARNKKGEIVISLQGGKLAGGNPKDKRVDNDFYATDPKAVEMLIEKYSFNNGVFLEPCVGNGNISKVIELKYPNSNIEGIDIVDRGYPNTVISNFLTYKTDKKYDNIITNPPYSLAKEFVEKGMEMLNSNGKMAMFLKIQFLESEKRIDMFKKHPPKYIYVFSKRMATWNNGEPTDKNGKRWATTMCHAWFVWEKNNKEEPKVRWLY